MTTLRDAIIYLRLSDFRDEDDATFTAREAELRAFAGQLGLNVVRVAVENDVNGNGKSRPASAYKTPKRVTTAAGLITFRTNRPVFQSVVLDLQRGAAGVLIVSDDSRISRNHRDGLDLLDACRVSGASAVAPDDEGDARWILTAGGSHSEVSAFLDRVNDARKYSDDVAAKVRKGRRRNAGKSYQGGRRPYGYRVELGTEHLHRNLAADEAEARVIRDAAAAVLLGTSLASLARGLRDRGVPTVTGAAWTASTLRDVLSKPAVAGLAVYKGELRDAPWAPILDRDTWDRLTDLFASRANPGTSNAPRWLLSGIATCGVCGGAVKCTGTSDRRGYTCTEHGHVRRSAEQSDLWVAANVLALLQAHAPDLLRPPPRNGTDAGALRDELRKLAARKAALSRMFAADGDEAALASGLKVIRDRMADVERQLAASDTPDPLPEFRGADLDDDARLAIWDGLGIARQRRIVGILYDVVILPAARKGGRFDPESVRLTRKSQA